MGFSPSFLNSNPLLAFGFGLDKNKKVIKCKVVQALLRLYWRVTYRHLTRSSTENLTKWYIRHKLPKVICDDLARSFMSKIVTYQLSNQVFFTKRLYSPARRREATTGGCLLYLEYRHPRPS